MTTVPAAAHLVVRFKDVKERSAISKVQLTISRSLRQKLIVLSISQIETIVLTDRKNDICLYVTVAAFESPTREHIIRKTYHVFKIKANDTDISSLKYYKC